MKVYKYFLLGFILVFLLFPLMQFKLNLFELKKLNGDVRLAADTSINAQGWFSSDYQALKEKYFNDNFGLRSFYVCLRNEVSYLLFNKLYAKEVVAGRSGYLYELKYLETHAGMDFIGDEQIERLFYKIKFIQDTLQKQGITFALLFAPGKASYYPEFIPAPYDNNAQLTNYRAFSEKARAKKIEHIDFNQWFVSLKDRTPYPLYPKTGTHWSIYGIHVAFDSLAKFMEEHAGRKMAKFDYSNVELSDSLRHPDGDIARGLNLLHELPHFTMAYPNVKWTDTVGVFKPNVLTIADSYWMEVYFSGLPGNMFAQHEFWYYNKMLYHYDRQGKYDDPVNYDLKTSIEKNNFIFIMATEASLKNMGWGIIDELYVLYKGGPSAYGLAKKQRKKISEINRIKNVVLYDEKWLAQVKKQAEDLKISVDSAAAMNAVYYYNEVHKNDPPQVVSLEEAYVERMEEIKALMRQSKEWMAQLAVKAKERKVSLDSCMNQDAKWVAGQDMVQKRTEYYKALIRQTPKWLKDIEVKAKNRDLALDSCIREDARYMAQQESK